MDIDSLAERLVEAIFAEIEQSRSLIKQNLASAIRPHLAEAFLGSPEAKADSTPHPVKTLGDGAVRITDLALDRFNDRLAPYESTPEPAWVEATRAAEKKMLDMFLSTQIIEDDMPSYRLKTAKMKAMKEALALNIGVDKAVGLDKFVADHIKPNSMIMTKVTG